KALSTRLKLLKLTPFSELSFHSPKSINRSFTGAPFFSCKFGEEQIRPN
ncbi:hypothetical protein LINPERPRIM_LOCUS31305, partial [Linum perenne]